MARKGSIVLQAADKSDVFLSEEVKIDGIKDPFETVTEITEPAFDTDKAWVTGDVPKVIPVDVDGDASVLYGWFKGENFTDPFVIRIYVEYEEVDELLPLKEEVK